jgi:hypothetical protein
MVMENEMLSIVATLKKIQGMFLGADLHVFTDQKNLTFDTLRTQCVLLWHTKIVECSPMIHYIEVGGLQVGSPYLFFRAQANRGCSTEAVNSH